MIFFVCKLSLKSCCRCRYRFEAEQGERVKLTITRLATGFGKCQSVLDPVVGRHRCIGNGTATVVVHEVPWNQVTLSPQF
jgi:hypothetical protein